MLTDTDTAEAITVPDDPGRWQWRAPAPPDVHALFPGESARRRIETLLGKWLAAAHARRRSSRVSRAVTVQDFTAELAAFDFTVPWRLDDLLQWTMRRMESGIVQVSHPRYFGLFNPAPSFPAECADRIAAHFNPQLATATTSPFPVAVEAHVVRALARRAGFADDVTGHFTSGGSEANFTALICALTRAHPGFATEGARAFGGAPLVYVSHDAHRAWVKAAHQAGIGRNATRLVPTDGTGRMAAAQLTRMVCEDRAAGAIPVMIVATAGTTGAGMIDPIAPCADLARDCGAWLHVDAAWAGGALASNRLLPYLAGIETADSVTIDAHKWFATTMGCGIFITPHAETLHRSFAVTMECMPSANQVIDPYLGSAQWSRRFVGLRLFLALGSAGWQGYARHVEHAIERAADLEKRLHRHGWRTLNASPFAVLCMAPPSGDAVAIARRVVQSGEAWVSAIAFEGTPALRMCITSGETKETDLDLLVSALMTAEQDSA